MKRLVFLFALVPGLANGQSFWADTTLGSPYSVLDVHVRETGDVYAGAIGALFRSQDQGQTWEEVYDETVYQIAEDAGLLYIATGEGLLTSDTGTTWEVRMPARSESVSVDGPLIAVGGSGGQYYLSEDGGETWSVRTCELMPQGYDSFIDPVFVAAEFLLFTHSFDGLFASTDKITWSYDEDLDPRFFVRDGTGQVFIEDAGRLLRSNDGVTWVLDADTPFFSIGSLDIKGSLFALGSFSGLLVSDDKGETWMDWSEGLFDDPSDVVIDAEGFVYAAVGDYVQRSLQPITSGAGTSVEEQVEVPRQSIVQAVYPNPSNGEIRVSLYVASSERVIVEAIDALGRKLETLLDRELSPGGHTLRWSPRLPSGTYFVRMRAGQAVSNHAVTLTR